MFKATARLYDKRRKVMAEHTALGATVPLASEAAIRKLLDMMFRRVGCGCWTDRGDAGGGIKAVSTLPSAIAMQGFVRARRMSPHFLLMLEGARDKV